MQGSAHSPVLDEADAWRVLDALSRRAQSGQPLARPACFDIGPTGDVNEVAAGGGLLCIDPHAEPQVEAYARIAPAAASMLDLYLPLCVGAASSNLVVGHIGQSLDGQIATASGASRYVTGPENIRHMHRLRALFDAVIVGGRTIEQDDPQLTTRLVPGQNPTRVVLDPTLRLSGRQQVFRDAAAPTLVLAARGSERAHRARDFGHASVVEIDAEAKMLPVQAIVEALQARGLRRLFIEGGGVTISRFLTARAFQRLHVTVCPIFIGSGRPGVVLPGIDRLDGALRPRSRRFVMGDDVLFDCSFDVPP
jgi:diaminohydroxyphosphoribosylaminopyrimidine deaminase/5-amino-6-(5-phosphoribosylamino)uracil reductase